MRRILTLLVSLGIALAVCVAGGVWALSQGWQRDWVREQLELQLETALEKPVTIGALEGVLYREWILSQVRIGEADAPLATLGSVAFELGSLRVFGTPRLTVDRLRLHDAQLDGPGLVESRWPWQTDPADRPDGVEAGAEDSFRFLVRAGELGEVTLLVARQDGDETLLRLNGVVRELEVAEDVSLALVDTSLAVATTSTGAEPWVSGRLRGSYAEGRWRLAGLELGGPVFRFEGQGRGDSKAIEELRFAVEVPSIQGLVARTTGEAPALDGTIQIEGQATGSLAWPRVTAAVNADALALDGKLLGNLSMKLGSESRGDFAFEELRFVRPRGSPPTGSASSAGADQADGKAVAPAYGDGEARSVAWLAGHARGSLLEGKWRLDELRLEGPVLDLEAQGRGDSSEFEDARVSLRAPSIAALYREFLSDPPNVAGSVELTAEWAGEIQWPRMRASLIARDLAFDGQVLGDIALKGRSSAPGKIDLDAVQWKNGFVDLSGGAGGRVTSGAAGTRVESLRLKGAGQGGTLNVQVSLPPTGELDFETIARSAQTKLGVDAEDWSLVILQPFLSALGMRAEGVIDLGLSLNGTPAGLGVEGNVQVQGASGGTDSGTIEGADLELSVSGLLASPTLDFAARADRSVVGATELGALVARGTVRERLVTIERFELRDGFAPIDLAAGSRLRFEESGLVRFEGFRVQEGEQGIALEGAVGPDSADDFRIKLSRLDVSRIIRWARALEQVPEGPALSGLIDGQLRWHGPRTNPEFDGHLGWTDPVLGELEFETIDLEFETVDASLVLTNEWRRAGTLPLELEGELPRGRILVDPARLLEDPRTRIEATMADFELAALGAFLPSSVSQVGGILTAHASVAGGIPEPRITGLAELAAGFVKLPGLGGQSFGPIEGRVTLNGDRVSLDRLRVGRPESGVEGRGEFSFDGTGPRALRSEFEFSEFPLDITGLVRGVVSGQVAVSGELDALDLTGRIALAGVRAQIPDPEAAILREIRITTSDGDVDSELNEETSSLSLLDTLRIDLQVELSRNSWARGRGAEIELRGNIEADKKRHGKISLSGTVETVRGTYEVYGRRFRVERGEVTLDGSVDPDPILDVRAVHRVRDVRIYAIIEGRLSEPLLRFESVPDLDETDIASYLLFGRPMAGSAGEEQVALDAVAAQIVTGAALREFERRFGGALPVDLIDLRLDNNGQSSEVHAGVGKYVGDRLFLYYERGFGDVPTDELKAEYELTPNWSVESTVTGDGETAGDIVFEIEY